MYRRLIEEQFIVHKTSHSRVNVFCQILTHNGYEFVHGSRWLKMELNQVVKKHNHTAGSPRCSFCLYSNLAMMTKGLCTVHIKSLPASLSSLATCTKLSTVKEKIKMTQ